MKIKINKIHITTAIVLSTTCLCAGCGADTTGDVPTIDFNTAYEENTANKALEKETDRNDESQEKNTADTSIYDDILAEYSDMVQNDFYENLRDSDTYESSFGEHIGLEIRTHKQDIYYALYDIDGNGTNELVIASGKNDFFWMYDLYGYDGTKAVHIFPDMEFGYRTNFSLYENGVILVHHNYSRSTAEYYSDFYKIGNDGFTPELVDSFDKVLHVDGDGLLETYSRNGNEITGEEYEHGTFGYMGVFPVLDWVQLQ